MVKRLAVALAGCAIGALPGWALAHFTGWSVFTIIGMLAGSLIAVTWAEKRGRIASMNELQKPQPLSLADPDDKA